MTKKKRVIIKIESIEDIKSINKHPNRMSKSLSNLIRHFKDL